MSRSAKSAHPVILCIYCMQKQKKSLCLQGQEAVAHSKMGDWDKGHTDVGCLRGSCSLLAVQESSLGLVVSPICVNRVLGTLNSLCVL